jgi:hypothetical protein
MSWNPAAPGGSRSLPDLLVAEKLGADKSRTKQKNARRGQRNHPRPNRTAASRPATFDVAATAYLVLSHRVFRRLLLFDPRNSEVSGGAALNRNTRKASVDFPHRRCFTAPAGFGGAGFKTQRGKHPLVHRKFLG